jgi:hypothetical protein
VAPNGTAYCWHSNSSATSNSNKVACPGLNNGALADVDLNISGGESSPDMYEAGGVIWSTAQTISSVAFVNGTWESTLDGSFDANMTLQTTTDGSTWTNSSWTVSPSYTYNASDAGTTFTFSGSGSITVLGVRISGEVYTSTNTSWYENMREVLAYTTSSGGTNVAPNGTAYSWSHNSSATSNSNQVACPGLNDGNTSTDVDIDGGSPESSADYEAGGVIWSSSQTISSVAFINGTWESTLDGSFDANMTLQTTTNGTTWTNSSWTVSPSYAYNASNAGTTFTFSGSAVSVLGVRISGQLHTSVNTSYYELMREVMAYTSGGGSAPAAPTNLQGTAVSDSQINLTWTASSGATGYYVYRNSTQVGSPTTNSYSDTGLAASTQYSYYVSAYNSYGTSGNSSTIQVTTESSSGGSAPAAPSNLQGTAVSDSQINLTWNASSGATGYYVYRNSTQVGSPTTNSYSDTGLAASTQYSYYVAAYNSYGTSGNSSTIQVTTESSGGGSLPPQLQNFFPVGPYDQPNTTMAAWASRNANTLNAFGDGSETLAEWDSAADAAGLKFIRAPDSPASNDIGKTDLLAWDQGDEDEANGVTAATAVAQYNTWKGIDPNRLVFINFSGGYLLGLQGGCNASCYAAYLPAADWLSSDVYPVAGWDSPANIVAPNNWVGQSVATLQSWAPTKPIFQIMESSEQNLSWCPQCPAPTPAQFHAEFWDDIINGARGVFTFPLAISPFVWDNTTAAMDTQITTDYATTKALASVLQTTLNPSGMSATVTAPLEACWRDSTHQYFIVLNTDSVAHNSEAITLTGTGSATSAVVYGESRNVNIVSGVITDNFAADTVHIYQVN